MPTGPQTIEEQDVERIHAHLRGRNIVMIGMMGAGKTSVGRRLAAALDLPFVDADAEIEQAANLTIAEIFSNYGEDHFREGERKVIARLLDGETKVLATGGGAFIHPQTREKIRQVGISIWLKADLPILMRRVARRNHRPLIATGDKEATMRKLMQERYPVYEQADITILSCDVPHDAVVDDILKRLLNLP